MNKIKHLFYSLPIILSVACSTPPTPKEYSKEGLALHLSQAENFDLIFQLQNTTSTPITNAFPTSLFEGKILLLQEEKVPIKAYQKQYLFLLICATMQQPSPHIIDAGKSLNYTIPLNDLAIPFHGSTFNPNKKIFAYATMDHFEIKSNVIELKQYPLIEKGDAFMDKYFKNVSSNTPPFNPSKNGSFYFPDRPIKHPTKANQKVKY
jgi:hypothetical protein